MFKVNSSAYMQIAAMGARITFAYRSNTVFQLINVLVQLYILKTVWVAVYAGRENLRHIHLSTLIVYLTLANLQTWVLAPTITDDLQQRVRTGQVALDLARPIGFIGQLVAQQIGITLSLVPFVVIALPIAVVLGGIQPPPSGIALLLYAVSFLLAYIIVVLISVIMGLVSFWTLEATGIQEVYRFVNQLFAGALVPLWFFPPILQTIAMLLPFQSVAFLPVSIYLGKSQGADALHALGIQCFWICTLYILTQIIWSRAQRRVIVQGG